MKIANNITDLIGKTPLLQTNNIAKLHNLYGNVIAKLECFNPLSSVKDRIGHSMIKEALNQGVITKETTIIEPTSGNTGIALAYICATLGFKLILTMPETMTLERRKIIKAFGAETVLTEGAKGMKGALARAEELHNEIENSIILQQFANPANPQIHRETTAVEILHDTDHKVDVFVSGIGTGGTITGVGEVLRQHLPHVEIIAVEPEDSPVLSRGTPGPHKIQGIGAGFVPQVLNTNIYDRVITVTYENAVWASRELAKHEGILVGVSSGAAYYVVFTLAREEKYAGKNIVVILPDTGERYLSTVLFEE